MSHAMKTRKLNSLRSRYNKVEAEALRLMKAGDLHHYIQKLITARKMRTEYAALMLA